MPIPALHRERLRRAIEGHEAELYEKDRPLSPERARVHKILIELGRNEDVLALIDDFLDSSELAGQLSTDPDAVLSTRGITLPEGVALRVVPGHDDHPQPVLRFQFRVRGLTMFADWDPESGPYARARGPHEP
ncbi:hypothetical protein ACWGPD_09535 [Streptomyces hirsutus]|uniref:hypothetical protein n=1 Tax=Streptomyces hirsutus TaxID=35620 RepID=UPI0036343EF5